MKKKVQVVLKTDIKDGRKVIAKKGTTHKALFVPELRGGIGFTKNSKFFQLSDKQKSEYLKYCRAAHYEINFSSLHKNFRVELKEVKAL